MLPVLVRCSAEPRARRPDELEIPGAARPGTPQLCKALGRSAPRTAGFRRAAIASRHVPVFKALAFREPESRLRPVHGRDLAGDRGPTLTLRPGATQEAWPWHSPTPPRN